MDLVGHPRRQRPPGDVRSHRGRETALLGAAATRYRAEAEPHDLGTPLQTGDDPSASPGRHPQRGFRADAAAVTNPTISFRSLRKERKET